MIPEIKISRQILKNKGNSLETGFKRETIDLLSYMLQVGDAAWFQFIPMKFGNHIVNLSIFREEKQIFGTSATIEVKLTRRLRLQKIARRLTGVGGIIPPTLRTVFFVLLL